MANSSTVIQPYAKRRDEMSVLNSFLNEETTRYEFEYNSKRAAPMALEVTEEEKLLAEERESSFPEDLQFSVKVSLMQSKLAYLAFVNGLNDGQSQSTVMELYPHDPLTYPCPIGDIDFSFLDENKEQTNSVGGVSSVAKRTAGGNGDNHSKTEN